jgi:hypothetical protein
MIFEMRYIPEGPGAMSDLLSGTENTAYNVFVQVFNKVNFTKQKSKSPTSPRTKMPYDFLEIGPNHWFSPVLRHVAQNMGAKIDG